MIQKTNRRQHGTINTDNNPEIGYLVRKETHGQGDQNQFFMLTHDALAPKGSMRAIPIPPTVAIEAGKGHGSDTIIVPHEDKDQPFLVATPQDFPYNGTYERVPEGWRKINDSVVWPQNTATNYTDLEEQFPPLPIDPETEATERAADQHGASITGDEKPWKGEPDSA